MGRFRQHPAVRAELRGAAAWYEERAGLGADLFDKFDQAIDEIIRVPRTWVRWATAPPDMEIRRYFRKLVELEFPHLAVLSYQELSPEMNIQPIARISLG